MTEQTQTTDQQLQQFLHIMETSLRSGYNIRQSMEIVCKDGRPALVAEVQQLLTELDAGDALPDVLERWRVRRPSLALDIIVAGFQVQFESGGNLANKLLFLSQLLPKLNTE